MKSSRAKKNSCRSLRLESLESREMLDAAGMMNAAAVSDVCRINLSECGGYKSYYLDAEQGDTLDLKLYAVGKEGDILVKTRAVTEGTTVEIIGNSKVAETLTITINAQEKLNGSDFFFEGDRKDSLVVEGYQANSGKFFIKGDTREGQEVGKVEIQGNAWKLISTVYSSAALKDVRLVGSAKGNTYYIDKLVCNYTIDGGTGENSLNFSDATGELKLDLNAKNARKVLSDSAGKLKVLNPEYIAFVDGTAQSDTVIGVKKGAAFFQFRDLTVSSNKVTVSAANSSIRTFGAGQQITIRGGECELFILEADNSKINASAANKDSVILGTIMGNDIKMTGGRGSIGQRIIPGVVSTSFLTVIGDNFTMKAASASEVIVNVAGDNAKITGGRGNDFIMLQGDHCVVNTGNGDDAVMVTGEGKTASVTVKTGNGNDKVLIKNCSQAQVRGGNGNDLIISDGGEPQAGSLQSLFGDAGDDVILAPFSSFNCELDGGSGNDILFGGYMDDTLIDKTGMNMLIGLGGADNFTGGSKADILIADLASGLIDIYEDTQLYYTDRSELIFTSPMGDALKKILDAWVAGDRKSVIETLNHDAERHDGYFCLPDKAADTIVDKSGNNLIYYNPTDDHDTAIVKTKRSADKFFEKREG